MTSVLLLDDLMKQGCKWEDYGLKTAELVAYANVLPDMPHAPYTTIPDFFGVPLDVPLPSDEVMAAYAGLTRAFDAPKIILARSSDPEEAPGTFESHTSLFDPTDKRGSFQAWLAAAEKVKASGARAVMGQVLFGDLEDFAYDYQLDDEYKDIPLTKPVFGGSMTGFVGNSWSRIVGHAPQVMFCHGLPSKIVRGDEDVCIAQKLKHRTLLVALNHSYRNTSHFEFAQDHQDVIPLETPTKIIQINQPTHLQHHRCTSVKEGMIPLPHWYLLDGREEHLRYVDLLDIVEDSARSVDDAVELEGGIDQHKIGIFQVRPYDTPKQNRGGLTPVDDSRLLASTQHISLGYHKFQGDLVFGLAPQPVEEGQIFVHQGEISIPDLAMYSQYKRLVVPFASIGGLYEGSHAFGYTLQFITALEKKHDTQVIAVGHTHLFRDSRLLRHTVREGDVSIARNVTIECDGNEVQVYLND